MRGRRHISRANIALSNTAEQGREEDDVRRRRRSENNETAQPR